MVAQKNEQKVTDPLIMRPCYDFASLTVLLAHVVRLYKGLFVQARSGEKEWSCVHQFY